MAKIRSVARPARTHRSVRIPIIGLVTVALVAAGSSFALASSTTSPTIQPGASAPIANAVQVKSVTAHITSRKVARHTRAAQVARPVRQGRLFFVRFSSHAVVDARSVATATATVRVLTKVAQSSATAARATRFGTTVSVTVRSTSLRQATSRARAIATSRAVARATKVAVRRADYAAAAVAKAHAVTVATAKATSPAASAVAPPTTTQSGPLYYVSCSKGSDTNPGTSAAAPWATLAAIAHRTFKPGSTIQLAAGCTFSGGLYLNGSGTSSAPIRLTSYGAGAKPLIQSDGSYFNTIEMYGGYQIVENLNIVNARNAGVGVHGTHSVVRYVDVSNSGEGVEVSRAGDHTVVTHNTARNLRMVVNTPGGNNDYGAVGYSIGASDVTVSYNTCNSCQAASYDYGTDGGFIEVFNKGDNLWLTHNLSVNSDGFIEVGGNVGSASANNMRIDNNVIVNNTAAVNIQISGNYKISVMNLYFDNNTIVQTTAPRTGNTRPFYGTNLTTKARNNIFYLYPGQGVSSEPWTHSGNLFWDYPQTRPLPVVLGSTERFADPQFVNIAAGDYRLRATSPARGIGQPVGYAATSYNGVALSAHPDAGAYQNGT